MTDLVAAFRKAKRGEASRKGRRGRGTKPNRARKVLGRSPGGVLWICYREPGETDAAYATRCDTMRSALRALKAKRATKKATKKRATLNFGQRMAKARAAKKRKAR